MAIAGAILGDIIGSQYEFDPCDNPKTCPLFSNKVMFTDDTVLTLAVKYAIDTGSSFIKAFKEIGRRYPDCGYAGMFENWLRSDKEEPYGSWGNGSAMRTSYIGEYLPYGVWRRRQSRGLRDRALAKRVRRASNGCYTR